MKGIDKAIVACLACVIGCGGLEGDAPTWLSLDEIVPPLTAEVGDVAPRFTHGPDHLRVVTFNLKDGGVDAKILADAFAANPNLASADVVMLQEAVGFPGQDSRVAPFARALGMGWVYAPGWWTAHAGTLGDAILSRYPLTDIAVMRLNIDAGKQQRVAVQATVQTGGEPVTLVTTHLDTTLNITHRILQLRPAVIDLPRRALVGGDFNTNPYAWQSGEVPIISTSQVVDTDQAPQLDDYMGRLGFVNPTAALGPTNEHLGIETRLDAVFVRDLPVIDRGVERSITLSDHWPVWVDVATN